MITLDFNPQFERAFQMMENTGRHVFVTGKAGTGKSTLLRFFLKSTKKSVAVLAPTGVAALNVGGQTIHSFFRFPTHVTVEYVKNQKIPRRQEKLLRQIGTIVIDEVSMVRADLMDCMDQVLQKARKHKEPFGGVQMIFIGDLYQLPPVVSTKEERQLFSTLYESPYFFSATVLEKVPLDLVELEKVYRQKDEGFVGLLNKIRNNSVQDEDLARLNARCVPSLPPSGKNRLTITLTTTNAAADIQNGEQLAKIQKPTKTYEGLMTGEFDASHLPTSQHLSVKIGAQIMMVNNDSKGRWVNGTMGMINGIARDDENKRDILTIRLADGQTVEVAPITWELYRYVYQPGMPHPGVEVAGSFTQYPLRLAWAVTIHKSQGKTFDNIVIDLGRGAFAHGQVYVALSRCTNFEGIFLKMPLQKKHIFMDHQIVRFLTRFQYALSEVLMPTSEKMRLLSDAIETGKKLQIVYLKPDDTKFRREIIPQKVGPMSYAGKSFLGLEAFCLQRKDARVFRVDRILEMR